MRKKLCLFTIPIFLILLYGVFYAFASKLLFDYDFWWHISTGKYIVETHKIPEADPFSYTTDLPENKNLFPEREKFILKQYWLAQVIFYLIYDYAGPMGIILMRAIILTALLLLVFYRLRKWDVSYYISLFFIFLLFSDAIKNIGERPVLFTMLFTPLTFIILEGFKEKQKKLLFLLPPIMLLWANMHGGFIIGNIMIVLYMIGEGSKIILKKVNYTKREIVIFYALTTGALAFSYINPTGWDAFSIALSSDYKFMEEGIQEYASPFFLYKERIYPTNYAVWVILLFFPLILILRNKKMDITHIMLVACLFIPAVKTNRYLIYYASIATMVLGKETDMLLKDLFKRKIPEKIYTKMTSALSILASLSFMLFIYGAFMNKPLDFGLATGYSVPKGAVNFIEKNRISGNLFNDGGFGGYVTWRLYTWKKTFIDTRWLNYTLKSELYWVLGGVNSLKGGKVTEGKSPLWERLLEHYNINFTLLAPFDVYGQVYNIMFALSESDKWVPVFSDPISIIFVKNTAENQDIISRYKQTKENIYNALIYRACIIAKGNENNPKSLISLGKIFYKMGRLKEAITAYKYALERSPHKEPIKIRIEEIESELEKESKVKD